jgi:hemerythrin
MRTLQWSKQMVIGHDVIDQDHEMLISLIGKVEEMLEGDGPVGSEHSVAYTEFLDFLAEHCAREEDLMHMLPPLYQTRVVEHCQHHGTLINLARTVGGLLVPGNDCKLALDRFQSTIIAMTRDLIMDDVELVGFLLLERRSVEPL